MCNIFNYLFFQLCFLGLYNAMFSYCVFFSTIRMVLENNKNAEWITFWNNVSITNQLPEDYTSDTWKKKAIQCSHRQKDSLHEPLKSSSIAQCCKNDYLNYTSNHHITRYQAFKAKSAKEPGTSYFKRTKRTSSGLFDFLKNCIF